MSQIVCHVHDVDVDVDDTGGERSLYLRGTCPEDGGHEVEVEAD